MVGTILATKTPASNNLHGGEPLGTATDEPLSILKFWRDLEVFNIPAAPTAKDNTTQTKISTLRQGNTLPWHKAEFTPTEQHAYLHVVYIGVADTEDLARLLLRALLPNEDLSEREVQRLKGHGWLAAFVVNELGTPLPDSYLAASFAHGIDAFRQTGSLDNVNARLDRAREEFAQRCHQIAPVDAESKSEASESTQTHASFDWKELGAEREIVRALLGDATRSQALDWRVIVRSSRIKRSKLKDNLDAATNFLNSFYLDDLDRLIDQANCRKPKPFGAALSRYLGEAIPPEDRIDILKEHATMAGLVSAMHLPSTRWPAPSRFPLFLAQQAAVAHTLQTLKGSSGLVGVNGPPGTGKTTLLCDVIAEIVTERARRIANLGHPNDLFEKRDTVAGKGFFRLKPSIMDGTSIVVTSNNNNAVKNITQELPAREKISREFGAVAYFDEVIREVFRAQKVLDDEGSPIDAWGVFAAALGNVGNRRAFATGFFRDEYVPKANSASTTTDTSTDTTTAVDDDARTRVLRDSNHRPPSMKQVLEIASKDYRLHQDEWHAAKRNFLHLQSEFELQRAILVRAENAARELDRSQSQLDDLETTLRSLEEHLAGSDEALTAHRQQQSDQRMLVQAHQATLTALAAEHLPTLWDRLMAFFGRETPRMARRRRVLEPPTRQLAEATATLAHLSQAVTKASANLTREHERQNALATERTALRRQRETHQEALDAGNAAGAKHFSNDAFWAQSFETQHRASIAVSESLDQLRSRLFLAAMELHRLTILANAGKFIGNLRVVSGMLTNSLQDKLPPDQRPWLWDALFFVVPVISTTLASFDRLFVGMEQDSLGWLLIDEAGQATPQSAAGAIWRSCRVVVVGDPLQIEPVFTVPQRLTEALRQQHGLPPSWSPADESVQTLADRISPYGSWVHSASESDKDSASRIWTGMPLRTHLRCDDPMFSVANRIAYAGQMVQGRVDEYGDPKPIAFSSTLGESAWFNVPATADQHPVQEDELALLHDLLDSLRREPAMTLPDKPARIYVISPFRKIGDACRARVRKAKFEGIECGTVHTFQGKQADIVFLVLGTAPGQQGAGARAWAASKPNLLNVAITRAKCRLYVIGDVGQWGDLDYFRELRRVLPVRTPSIESREFGKSMVGFANM